MPKGKILMGKKTPKPAPDLYKKVPATAMGKPKGKTKPVMPRRGGK